VGRPVLSDDEVQAFRRRACDVSIELFGTHGYEQFSLRSLARELGCSHATPYRYFASKDEIFAEVRAEGFRRFASFLKARLEASKSARARLRILALAYFDFALEQPAAFRIIFELGQPTAESYPVVNQAAGSAWGVLVGVVDEAIAAGVLAGRSSELAHAMWAGIHGVATLELAHKLGMGMTGAKLVEHMTDALIAAYAPSDAARTRKTGKKK
jgi:AcrR family transcriptional regulator